MWLYRVARGDAEQLGDRGDGAAGVGQQVACGPDDFLGGDCGASADAAPGAGCGQALVGADDDEFADELREGGEDVEDEPAAGGGLKSTCANRVWSSSTSPRPTKQPPPGPRRRSAGCGSPAGPPPPGIPPARPASPSAPTPTCAAHLWPAAALTPVPAEHPPCRQQSLRGGQLPRRLRLHAACGRGTPPRHRARVGPRQHAVHDGLGLRQTDSELGAQHPPGGDTHRRRTGTRNVAGSLSASSRSRNGAERLSAVGRRLPAGRARGLHVPPQRAADQDVDAGTGTVLYGIIWQMVGVRAQHGERGPAERGLSMSRLGSGSHPATCTPPGSGRRHDPLPSVRCRRRTRPCAGRRPQAGCRP